MQIETTKRYYFIPTKMAISKTMDNKKSVSEDVEKLEPSHIAGGNVK